MQRPHPRHSSRGRRVLVGLAMAAVVATAFAPTTSAFSVRRTWNAALGGNGTNGTATLTDIERRHLASALEKIIQQMGTEVSTIDVGE